ncbi:hypothetical protein ACFOY8_14300 [Thalassospira xianhensis]|uniref:Uncharacterized protein n=1 Tax=Thalassospira xianhensis MCCC 1A02616 TaxID=1177929 RepID=A0A367UH83_9PROT|nr:hypothetical protein [Thalassospira xianhensis]RCK07675.1 hypothetical protein TH5_00965 [Thalassospira xianhensis MCCC 1A02616]
MNMQLPRVSVSVQADNGTICGKLDITKGVLTHLANQNPREWTVGSFKWSTYDLVKEAEMTLSSPEGQSEPNWAMHLGEDSYQILDFNEQVAEFLVHVDSRDAAKAAQKYFQQEEVKQYAIEEATRRLGLVSSAQYSSEIDTYVFLNGHTFVGSLEEVRDLFDTADFEKENPRPLFNSEKYAVWERDLKEWQRKHCQPYVFASLRQNMPPVTFEAMAELHDDAIDTASYAGNEPEIELDGFFASLLEYQYEDAEADLVDYDAFVEAVKQWEKVIPRTEASDTEFSTFLTNWNARQTVHSYIADFRRVLPVWSDVTKDEMVAYANKQLENAIIELEDHHFLTWQEILQKFAPQRRPVLKLCIGRS